MRDHRCHADLPAPYCAACDAAGVTGGRGAAACKPPRWRHANATCCARTCVALCPGGAAAKTCGDLAGAPVAPAVRDRPDELDCDACQRACQPAAGGGERARCCGAVCAACTAALAFTTGAAEAAGVAWDCDAEPAPPAAPPAPSPAKSDASTTPAAGRGSGGAAPGQPPAGGADEGGGAGAGGGAAARMGSPALHRPVLHEPSKFVQLEHALMRPIFRPVPFMLLGTAVYLVLLLCAHALWQALRHTCARACSLLCAPCVRGREEDAAAARMAEERDAAAVTALRYGRLAESGGAATGPRKSGGYGGYGYGDIPADALDGLDAVTGAAVPPGGGGASAGAEPPPMPTGPVWHLSRGELVTADETGGGGAGGERGAAAARRRGREGGAARKAPQPTPAMWRMSRSDLGTGMPLLAPDGPAGRGSAAAAKPHAVGEADGGHDRGESLESSSVK